MKNMIKNLLHMLNLNENIEDLSSKSKEELELYLREQMAYSQVITAANY